MTRPAIQLYSVRDLNEPLPDIVRRVADVGFDGVEFAHRFHRANVAALAAAVDETGVEPIGVHVELERLETNLQWVLNRFDEVGCKRAVLPHLPASHFRTNERIADLARRLGCLGRELGDRGFELTYHNLRHYLLAPLEGSRGRLLDSAPIPGILEATLAVRLRRNVGSSSKPDIAQTGLGLLAERIDPGNLSFEIDVGEVVAAGYDPAAVFAVLEGRTPLVHLRDVTCSSDGYESAAPGTGIIDLGDAAESASRAGAEWLVYEHDRPGDPTETIQRGLRAISSVSAEGRHTAP